MKSKLIGSWAISSLVVGVAGTIALYFAIISTARSLEWPGALAIVLSLPFIGIATIILYCVSCLIIVGIAFEKLQNNSLKSNFFIYVSKLNLIGLLLSFVFAVLFVFIF